MLLANPVVFIFFGVRLAKVIHTDIISSNSKSLWFLSSPCYSFLSQKQRTEGGEIFYFFIFFDRTCLCNAVTGNTIAKESIPTICTQRSLMKWYRWGPTQCTGLPTLNGVQMRWIGWFTQLGACCLQTQADVVAFPEPYLSLTRKIKNPLSYLNLKKEKGKTGMGIWLMALWRH